MLPLKLDSLSETDMTVIEELQQFLDANASDFSAVELDEPFKGYKYVISIVHKLSDGVISEIENSPTHTYFHHYRSVNRLLDDTAHKTGMILQRYGYDFYPIAASQSVNDKKDKRSEMTPTFAGVYSHKKSACLCGLGEMGINNLFIHKTFGSAVRLSTVFTNCPEVVSLKSATSDKPIKYSCDSCGICIKACPAGAVTAEGFDPKKCSDYMKNAFQHIGRGAVCGICIKSCMSKTKI